MSGLCLGLLVKEIPVLNANSVDSDQTPRSVASDWEDTVCKGPIYGALGLNGIKRRSVTQKMNKARPCFGLQYMKGRGRVEEGGGGGPFLSCFSFKLLPTG